MIDMTSRERALYHADALSLIRCLADDTIDAVITDPPYASGKTLTDKAASTAEKYTQHKRDNALPDFDGDAMDQRSWIWFMTDVLREARRACKSEAVCAVFIDWRQLPSLTDAFQRAGWIWRGVAVWDKPGARPQRGRFKQSAEFIVWGSNGRLSPERPVPVLPGTFSYANVPSVDRLHQTQKPLALMRQIVRICVPDGAILDPFSGSGSTLAAAIDAGYRVIGCEINPVIARTAAQRLGIELSEL